MAKINKTTIGNLADWLDNLIKLKGLAEQLDGFAIKTGMNLLNNKYGDLIPDSITPVIEEIINDVVDGNIESAKEKLSNLFAEIIKTPLIDGTEDEIEAYQTIISVVEQLIKKLMKPKAA
jgi:hypothetical protein